MVLFDEEDSKRATVVVPDNKLSLAIGRRGQNVRLAAHLTGYRIDIKSASEYEALEAEREAKAAEAQEAPAEEVVESADTEVVANDAE
jgi:N utilization substance protein A